MPHRGTIPLKEAVAALLSTLNQRDPLGYGHSRRVAYYSMFIADQLGYDIERKAVLQYAAYLHDIGKVGLPDFVLQSSEALSEDEFMIMKEHPQIGAMIVGEVKLFEVIKPIILQHHEWVDGSGYPYGLNSSEILTEAKIISIAGAFDTMTTDHPYRKALTKTGALNELHNFAGRQFDTLLVDVFTEIIETHPTIIAEAHGL